MSKIGKKLKTDLILKAPRITEKATVLTTLKSGPAYTFEVSSRATKPMIESSFLAKYKITPRKINIVNLPAKKTLRRGVVGSKTGVKKAIVFLKAGEKIEIV